MKFLTHALCLLIGALGVFIVMSERPVEGPVVANVFAMSQAHEGRGQATNATDSKGRAHPSAVDTPSLQVQPSTLAEAKLPGAFRGVLRGRCIDPSGAPVAGAQVKVKVQSLTVATGSSGADGAFEIGNLMDGYYFVEALSKGMAGRAQVRRLMPLVEVVLQGACQVKVRCRDKDGSFLSSFGITAYSMQSVGQGDMFFDMADGEDLWIPLGRWKLQANNLESLTSGLHEIDTATWNESQVIEFTLKEQDGIRFVLNHKGEFPSLENGQGDFLQYAVSKKGGGDMTMGGSIDLKGGHAGLCVPPEHGHYEVILTDFPWNKASFEYKGGAMTVEIPWTVPMEESLIMLDLAPGTDEGLVVLFSMGYAMQPVRLCHVEGGVGVSISNLIRETWKAGKSVKLLAHAPKFGVAMAEMPPSTRRVPLEFIPPAILRVTVDPQTSQGDCNVTVENMDGVSRITALENWYGHPIFKPNQSGVVELGPMIPGRHTVVVRVGQKIIRRQELTLASGLNEFDVRDISLMREVCLVGCLPGEAITLSTGSMVGVFEERADAQGQIKYSIDKSGEALRFYSERGAMVLQQLSDENVEFSPRSFTKLRLLPPKDSKASLGQFEAKDVLVGMNEQRFENYQMMAVLLCSGCAPGESVMIERGGKIIHVSMDSEKGGMDNFEVGHIFRSYGSPE